MPHLTAEVKALRKKLHGDLLVMRHGQGDQWDLMLLEVIKPTVSMDIRDRKFESLVAYQHSFLAESISTWAEIELADEDKDLHHINMFYAAAGKRPQLLEQPEMENTYYRATERAGNFIFKTVFATDPNAVFEKILI